MSLGAMIDQQLSSACALRHRLHCIPELAYEEHLTAAAIRETLDGMGIAHVDGVPDAPTATIAWIGDTSKPCVALRADIDALPITEQTGLSYASKHPGRMHACGHDGHITVLLGVAAILSKMIGRLNVCVKFIWQPAEEGGGGADRLCKAGVLDGRIGPKVAAIFGLHGWPGLPCGMVSTKPGPILAATDNFTATFVGRGCHAAFPHAGVDPIVTACEAVVNLQQFITREMDPTEPGVVTIGRFNAGTAINVIPDTATIEGTARTLSDAARELAEASIRRRCAGIAAANACELQFQWNVGYPATVNDPHMAEYVAQTARDVLGQGRYLPAARPAMGGEDFAYYLREIPGCFFLIGLCPSGRDEYPSLHSDRFDFTDAALVTGMRMFVELVTRYGARSS
jgi:amidohydrolase